MFNLSLLHGLDHDTMLIVVAVLITNIVEEVHPVSLTVQVLFSNFCSKGLYAMNWNGMEWN